jgi:hypothetical protein
MPTALEPANEYPGAPEVPLGALITPEAVNAPLTPIAPVFVNVPEKVDVFVVVPLNEAPLITGAVNTELVLVNGPVIVSPPSLT